jgi:hypothetical protein
MSGTPAGAVSGFAAYASTAVAPAVTFAAPVSIPSLGGGTTVVDKQLIATDKTTGMFGGRLYVAWSEFANAFDSTAPIVFTRSTGTAPLTFAAPVTLTADDALYQGAHAAVGPDGRLFVIWGRFTGSPTQIQLRRSIDGGGTFLPVQTIASIPAGPGSLSGAGITHRTRGFPYVAVDSTPVGSPTRGNVYAVFQGAGTGTDRVDVFFVRSTDGGVTWTAPRSINRAPAVTVGGDTTGNDNWQPSISVSPARGQITVAFYDRREDTTAADGDAANSRLRLYRAISTDGGLTWFNQPVSTVAARPAAGFDPLASPTYMGDYNYGAAVGDRITQSWADFRNPCTPPGGAPNPCSPAGRNDQDAFFDGTDALSGPDLFIRPWGAVTGEGPLWQTPAIFVVDLADLPINAAQGVVNRLRATVKNLGNATATNAVIRFRYAPIFAGLSDAGFKEIGTVTESFLAGEEKTIPINWDLTDTTDTNGGVWPLPISAFTHFCVRVSVELAADVNLANNDAQNNFDDVVLAPGGGLGPFRFLVGNPWRDKDGEFWLDVATPKGYRAEFPDSDIVAKRPFKLRRGEIRVASIRFVRAEGPNRGPDPTEDQNAEISLMRGEERVSGFTTRLERGRRDNTWDDFVDRSSTKLFDAVLAALKRREIRVVLADRKSGLIQTAQIPLSYAQLLERAELGQSAGAERAVARQSLSFRVVAARAKLSRVRVGSVIIIDGPQAVIFGGVAVRSSGRLERELLLEVRRLVGAGG